LRGSCGRTAPRLSRIRVHDRLAGSGYASDMAIYDVQYIKHATSGLPEDDFVNTLKFESSEGVPDPAVASALAGWVAACHFDAGNGVTNLETFIGPQVSRVTLPTIKVYDGSIPGSPLAVETQAGFRASGAGGYNLPSEVALCLSFRGDYGVRLEEAPDDADLDARPERPRSRVRGRIYEGPFGTDAVAVGTPGRPVTALMESLLDFGERLMGTHLVAGLLAANDVRFSVVSNATGGPIAEPVVACWVDNEWDTQRRRGIRATTRLMAP
jgi:hypothetical protein